MTQQTRLKTTPAQFVPDFERECANCGQSPVVMAIDATGANLLNDSRCGPCCFGEARMMDSDLWNSEPDLGPEATVPHHLTEPQWVDRFMGRLGLLVPAVQPAAATELARQAYAQASDLAPEAAADIYASEIASAEPLDFERIKLPQAILDPEVSDAFFASKEVQRLLDVLLELDSLGDEPGVKQTRARCDARLEELAHQIEASLRDKTEGRPEAAE